MASLKRVSGLDQHITRRDFVNGVAIGFGAVLLGGAATGHAQQAALVPAVSPGEDWYGYGGVGDYRLSHGNTPQAMAEAHRIRDGIVSSGLAEPVSTEEYDLVIIGGGMAGLGAALEYIKQRREGQSCLLLDNHPIFGGESKENEFNVNGTRLIAPQGANGFFIPGEVSDMESASGDSRYYAELEIPRELEYRDWPAHRKPLRFCQDNYGYLVRGLQENTSVGHFFSDSNEGVWANDMWRQKLANTPLDAGVRQSLLDWYGAGSNIHFVSDEQARKWLDTMSYKEFLEREQGMGAEGAKYADLFLASSCGLGSDVISAYAAYQLPMPGLNDPPSPAMKRNSFPGGNSGYARYFVKKLIPQAIAGEDNFEDIITGRINFNALDRPGQPIRIRLDSTAVSVSHSGNPADSERVEIVYRRGGKQHRLWAKGVIMATGGWINRYIVKDLPEAHATALGKFRHAPFLVANVALTNWQFLYKLGITAAIWDRAEGDFGYTCNIRNPMQVGAYQPPLDPDQPTVLSFYTPFYYPGLPIEQQVILGRAELFTTSYADYEEQIIRQMIKLFGAAGFDPLRDVAGIILNRWGHAYSVPYPGFYGGAGDDPAPRDIIRQGYGRIAFGHSELDGLQHWGGAADEGRRAYSQVKDAMLSS
ncbi:MAG: NAD(P)-binding protein [Proteobacteria bacterium]|nr:NAD(P)-binding protein [Pseudomonadota bacterium]